MTPGEHERMEDLLVQRATSDITPEEERELAGLVNRAADTDAAGWERAAAELTAVLLHEAGAEAAVPPRLAHTLVSQGQGALQRSAPPTRQDIVDIASRRRNTIAWMGWAVAAAAILALLLWPGRIGQSALPLTAAELRDSLVSADAAALNLAWSPTEDDAAAGASGDVVWSPRNQAGVMRIRGLRPNEPTRSQYQLWIFDSARDERFPVDGGVFDIPAGQDEVFVLIDANLGVSSATLFAVTIEQPGGVVVSDRQRIVLVAEVTG